MYHFIYLFLMGSDKDCKMMIIVHKSSASKSTRILGYFCIQRMEDNSNYP